jgi:hypothetical protein
VSNNKREHAKAPFRFVKIKAVLGRLQDKTQARVLENIRNLYYTIYNVVLCTNLKEITK